MIEREQESHEPLATIQELQFELIKRVKFNDCAGEQIVADLLANRPLWRGVVMDRPSVVVDRQRGYIHEEINLVKLRDIEVNQWNVDTLFILTSGVNDAALASLAYQWEASEVWYLENPEVGLLHPSNKVLRVWWD